MKSEEEVESQFVVSMSLCLTAKGAGRFRSTKVFLCTVFLIYTKYTAAHVLH